MNKTVSSKISKPYPIIGITIDIEKNNLAYSRYPWYALRKHYSDAIETSHGVPILLPYSSQYSILSQYVSLIDGLILTGGGFDIDPNLYGEKNLYPSHIEIKSERTEYEKKLLELSIKKGIPILGICGGMQLINVHFGGTLYQHLPDQWQSNLIHSKNQLNTGDMGKVVECESKYELQNHENNSQSNNIQSGKVLPHHQISLIANSKLHEIVQKDSYMVNSSHHQAIKTLGSNLQINARAIDGLIEGIEATHLPFIMGVQWHPEFCETDEDIQLLKSFIKACII